MYTSVGINSQIAAWRGVPCPTNKGVSYTNLVSGLVVTLKIDYYYYYYYYNIWILGTCGEGGTKSSPFIWDDGRARKPNLI